MRRPAHTAARLLAPLAAAVALCAAGPALGQSLTMDELPEQVRGFELGTEVGVQLPPGLNLHDPELGDVKLGDFFAPAESGGKPVLLTLMYFSCPLLCPKTTEMLIKAAAGLDASLGKDYRIIVVSFDDRDGDFEARTKKQQILRGLGVEDSAEARDGLRVLTGPSNQTAALAGALDFPFRWLPEAQEFSHATALFVLTPEGKVASFIGGLNFPPRDVRFALVEASGGKVGTIVDRLLSLCYHFDPNAGGYVPAAFRVMQIGAAAGAVVLFSFIGILFVMERRKRARGPAVAVAGPHRGAALSQAGT